MPRPKALPSATTKYKLGCGSLYVTVTLQDGKPFEVFATLGKAGGCAKAQLEALGKSIALGLQAGVPADEYIRGLDGISCPSGAFEEEEFHSSCAQCISKEIKRVVEGK
jgi:ribonucleoside-diphosphate reductase alpha chain